MTARAGGRLELSLGRSEGRVDERAGEAALSLEPARLRQTRITNYGGGNTSAKVIERDPLTGADVEVLWVKGSGGDVGSIEMDGFATLYMDKLNALRGVYRGPRRTRTRWSVICRTAPSTSIRAPPRSIRRCTPTSRASHVDHMHPGRDHRPRGDARFEGADAGDLRAERSVGCPGSGRATSSASGSERFCQENPTAKGVVLEAHGLFAWDDDAEACYRLTVDVINRAMAWLDERTEAKPAFGGAATREPGAGEERARIAAKL